MYLNRIEIENLRAIRHLKLDFGSGTNTRRWTVLLGENGCGKTTVLKAIGLVLAGSDALSELLVEVDEWILNGAEVARIRADISTAEGEPRRLFLEIRRGDGRDGIIRRNYEGLAALDSAVHNADRNYFVAGYGAFRRPPDPDRSSQKRRSRLSRADNVGTLFSAANELMSIEQWAMELDYRDGDRGRRIVRDALESLLPGMSFKEIDKRGRRILMNTQDGVVPLRNLSEGYQAMAAWAGDILYRMTETFGDWENPLKARGVLLIDEMDLHLHPVWKRSFIEFLNQAFPRLQIIATTHSPLSIQQCGEGELFVVKREDQRPPVLIPFVGDPSKLRLSELFLSPLIGLDTLDSPRVAALREEALTIELSRSKRSIANKHRLQQIARALEGTTPLPPVEAPAFASMLEFQKALTQYFPVDEAATQAMQAISLSTPVKRKAPVRNTPSAAVAKKIAPAKSASKKANTKKPK